MIPAILVIVGIAYLGIRVGGKARPHTTVGHAAVAPALPKRRVSYLALLHQVVAQGRDPSKFLVGEATREAMARNDWESVRTITAMFGDKPASQEQDASQEQGTAASQEQKSPLEGVSDEDWQSFVEVMRTKDATFKNGKFVGAWEHNLGRLRQLDIPEPKDESEQYAAFSKDMQTYMESEAKLLNDYSGEVVNIDGQAHAVTPSGLLGLLKSAGSDGAKSWLTNEADRKRFPNTTQAFLRANGAF